MLVMTAAAAAAKLEIWKQDTAAAFGKGKKERVVISDSGRVRLARELQPLGRIDAARVWDLVRAGDDLYAATGDEGKVFRQRAGGNWEVAHDAADNQALSLVAAAGGNVFAGLGPSGKVLNIQSGESATLGPEVKYVWDLAADAEGNLFAATGPAGQLWKRSARDGKWTLLLDVKQPHLLCVATAPDGAVVAGSDEDGVIYKVDRGGKSAVVYDAPQSEVHSLLIRPDGVLFAATSAEAGGGAAPSPNRGLAEIGGGHSRETLNRRVTLASALRVDFTNRTAQDKPQDAPGPGGTAAPRPGPPGENAVYRIGPDGAAREVLRAKTLFFALAWLNDRLYAGSGSDGVVYEISDDGRDATQIARLDNGQVLALLPDRDDSLIVAAGGPASVLRLSKSFMNKGSLISDVLDAKLASRVGAITWRGDAPKGTAIKVQVRTGNVAEPDDTWSSWSAELEDSTGSKAAVPIGRFLQYRVNLATDDPSRAPELGSIAIHYQTVNLAPEITKITIPDLTAGDGAARQTKLSVRWDATDPNDDELTYSLALRKDGWPEWINVTEQPLTEKTYAWDTTSVPSGTYRLRVAASDSASNPPREARAQSLVSEPFVVDHDAPTVKIDAANGGVSVLIRDAMTRITKAAYSLDSGEWTPIFPDDGLFDSNDEVITVTLANLKQGSHILVIRAHDAAGNVGTSDAILQKK